MKVAYLTTDNRSPFKEFHKTAPWFGPAPEAILSGLARVPGLEIHVVSSIRQPVKSPERLGDNVWFHSLHVPQIGWMRTLYQGCVRATRKKLREIAPDIVHGQGTELDCGISAALSGYPNVITIHGNMAELARLFGARVGSFYWLAGQLETFALKRTGGVFCNSAYTEGLVAPRGSRVWRVSNPLNLAYFETPPPPHSLATGKPVLLNIGLITERKRQLELLRVADALSRQGLSFELVFVGQAPATDPYAAAFLEQIKPLERRGCARYVGTKSVAEMIQLFDASHALVHWPAEESFGLVVAEALARGLRLFASRIGGVVDISTGVPGAELYDAGDLDSLTAALSSWLKQGGPRVPGATEIMRQRYHPDVIAARHLEIYREVLSRR
jgi:glycosyltransferase involved in cell wall biosynthesis